MRLSLPAVLTVFVTGAASAADAPLPAYVRGIVYGHHLVSYAREAATAVRVHATDLTSDSITHTLKVTEHTDRPASIAVRDRRLWLAYHSVTPASFAPTVQEHLRHFSVDAFCAGQVIPVNADGKSPREGLVVDWLWGELGKEQLIRLEKAAGPGAILQRDIVPIGDQAVLRFELVIPWPKPEQEPTGRMRVIRIESVYDAGMKQWKRVEATLLEDFEVGFTEPFQAIVVGKKYYFVTDSGKVFEARPPELRKPRLTVSDWDFPKARLSGLLTDTNQVEGHFAFWRDEKGWFYVRIGQGGPKRFDQPIPTDRVFPYETALEFARVLLSKEEIKLPGVDKR